jgi:PAS domain S-box-containing protein
MTELFGKGGKAEALKEIIRRLHGGASPEEVREEFKEAIRGLGPADIAKAEEELIREGIPREEIHKLCDAHISALREAIEGEGPRVPEWHPVRILMGEHEIILKFAGELRDISKRAKSAGDFASFGGEADRLGRVLEGLKDSASHYAREENVLFPYLERHGITQPPAIMWMEHDEIRGIEKGLYEIFEMRGSMRFREFSDRLEGAAASLADKLSSHFYKENSILFPTALEVLGGGEWRDVRRQFDELGYCGFTPRPIEMGAEGAGGISPRPMEEGILAFETGTLSKEEVEAILDTIPVDITFVDKDDAVRYFNQSKGRTFIRTKAVIGRKVQQCHPQKSLHVVNRILEEFKDGSRDVAEFWIDMKGRLIYIRYFPVRDKGGRYLGCIEVTQDITDVKKIEGEKRLL